MRVVITTYKNRLLSLRANVCICIIDPPRTTTQLIEGFDASSDVLIETFCDGIPIVEFAKKHKEDKENLTELCRTGIVTVCQMIFRDNFVHGDLHPGNVFVSSDGRKIILLDAGIAISHTPQDHDLIVDILASFIRGNGVRAGELLISDSNRRLRSSEEEEGDDGNNNMAVNEKAYVDKIVNLVKEAHGKGYLMKRLGTYMNYLCDTAVEHQVMMNRCFVSAGLAVKIQEGIVLSLDPNLEIWRIANPIIIDCELRRKLINWGVPMDELSQLWQQSKENIKSLIQ